MFLLKQARMVVVLVTIVGMILLPHLYIQPAQAEVVADVEAALQRQTKAEPQAGVKAEGLRCYKCMKRCKSNTDLGNITQCDPGIDSCVWGEIKEFDGQKYPVRLCAPPNGLDNYLCDKFTPLREAPGLLIKARFCVCKEDLCNTKDATVTTVVPTTTTTGTGSSSFSAQLILVTVSVFGCLMIM